MIRSILAAAAFATASTGCGPSGGAAPPPPAALPAGEPAALSEIQSTLARIESRLDVLEMTTPEPHRILPATATSEDPASSELVRLADEVRALRAALEEHLANDRESAGAGGLSALKAEYPDADWDALNELIHAWNLDPETTRQGLLLMGYRDVLAKYGSPTTTWGGKTGLHWLYYDSQDPVTGETRTEVWIHFADGFVTDMGIKQP